MAATKIRHKDRDWSDAPNTYENADLRVLMDIRDELKQLNAVFACRNAQMIPSYLRRILANTPKRRKGRTKT
jgi:hypothetical protein